MGFEVLHQLGVFVRGHAGDWCEDADEAGEVLLHHDFHEVVEQWSDFDGLGVDLQLFSDCPGRPGVCGSRSGAAA